MIEEIRTTYASTYFKDAIEKFLRRTEVVPEGEKARVQRIFDEDRKRIQIIVEARGKIIQHNESRGYDANGRLTRYYERGNLGTRLDFIA